VARERHALDRQPEPPPDLEVDDRQRDRNAGPALQDLVQVAVARVVVRAGVPGEAQLGEQVMVDRRDLLLRERVGREPPAAEAEIESRLVKEIRFDPDVWIVEVEDRVGRNFLDNVVT